MMKKTLTTIGILLMIFIVYIGSLNLIMNSMIEQKQSGNSTIIMKGRSSSAMVEIGVSEYVVTRQTRPTWYGDVIIESYNNMNFGRALVFGYPIVVIFNDFDMMTIHIAIIILFIAITFIIFFFELNSNGGIKNEKMD